MRTVTTRLAAAGAVVVLVLAGCGYDDTPLPEPEATSSPESASPADCTTDESTLESYAPSNDDEPPVGGAVARIKKEGRLRVGVSADTYLMGSMNPETNRIEGFDIEFVKAIAKEIFGADFKPALNIQYRVITAANRIDLLKDEELDLVVRNMTINCSRWEEVAFSAEYYHATQKVMLRKDLAETYTGPADLAGLRVCAPTGSTSLVNVTDAEPEADTEPADNHTGCLVKLQQGDVEAITGDDTVLAGLAAQDPYAVVPKPCDSVEEGQPCQDPIADEPYGIGANQGDRDLVELVNAVLEEMIGDDRWDRAYNNWLRPHLGQCTENCAPGDQGIPPTLRFGRL